MFGITVLTKVWIQLVLDSVLVFIDIEFTVGRAGCRLAKRRNTKNQYRKSKFLKRETIWNMEKTELEQTGNKTWMD